MQKSDQDPKKEAHHNNDLHGAIPSLICYLKEAPTAWHAVHKAKEILAKQGFSALDEKQLWNLAPGGKYWVSREGASLAAFILPKEKLDSALLLAAHSDSPSFKLRPHAQVIKEGLLFLGAEVYGHPIISSWLNRDLGLAGIVSFIDSNGQLQSERVTLDSCPLTLAKLAVHLDRQVNEVGPAFNKEEHLYLLAGRWQQNSHPDSPSDFSENFLERLIRQHCDCQQLIAHDLFAYPLEEPRLSGIDEQFLSAYRIDNLVSCHAALTALSQSSPLPYTLQLAAIWDHEEIGSTSSRGAESPFIADVLQRLHFLQGLNPEESLCSKNQSLCLSLDMAHAFHPLYPDRYQPQHRLNLGEGPALKLNANGRYASNLSSSAQLLALKGKGHLLQSFVSRNDMPCGSTIGPLFAAATGIRTADIGIPQLSMHAAREMIACSDYHALLTLLNHVLLDAERLAKNL